MNEDAQLISRTLNGDMQAFRWLITRHERLVAHIAGRIIQNESELEEVCQDIFMKVYDKLDTFRGDAKFSTWVASIAYRMSLNHVNRTIVYKSAIEKARGLAAESHTGQDELERSDRSQVLESALQKLPESQRMVITLFHLKEMSYEEVADITTMPVGTVKNYLFRGRKKLKEILETSFKEDL